MNTTQLNYIDISKEEEQQYFNMQTVDTPLLKDIQKTIKNFSRKFHELLKNDRN